MEIPTFLMQKFTEMRDGKGMGLKIVGNLKKCGYLFLMAEWLNAP